MANPTLVFVPGAFHSPDIYNSTIAILEKQGLSAVSIALPSVGADPPLLNFDKDVQAIRNVLTRLIVDEGKDVVLTAHSYAGLPAGDAAANLERNKREQRGLKGGIIRLVLVMSFAMPEGFQARGPKGEFPWWMRPNSEQTLVRVLPEDAEKLLYNDLPPEEAKRWALRLLPQSAGVDQSKTTYAAWRHVPSTFIIGKQDRTMFTREAVNFMLEQARQQVPSAFDVVEECERGGHCLMISHPDWFANAIVRAAGKG